MLLPKCGINWLMSFPCFYSLDIISMKRQKVPMDARRQILLSSNNFPSIINFIEGELTTWYSRSKIWPIFIDFAISTKARILVEHRFSIGNLILVLDPIIEISIPIGSSLFSILDLKVKILVLVGPSLLSIRAGVFLILVPTIEFFVSGSKSWLLDFGFVHRKWNVFAYTLYIF